jgi:hypothetical protein
VSQLAAPQNDIAARPNPSLTESPEQAGARLLQGTLATLNTWAVDPAKSEALLKTQLASLTKLTEAIKSDETSRAALYSAMNAVLSRATQELATLNASNLALDPAQGAQLKTQATAIQAFTSTNAPAAVSDEQNYGAAVSVVLAVYRATDSKSTGGPMTPRFATAIGYSESVSIASKTDMQTLMNALAHINEYVTTTLGAANASITPMARDVSR